MPFISSLKQGIKLGIDILYDPYAKIDLSATESKTVKRAIFIFEAIAITASLVAVYYVSAHLLTSAMILGIVAIISIYVIDRFNIFVNINPVVGALPDTKHESTPELKGLIDTYPPDCMLLLVNYLAKVAPDSLYPMEIELGERIRLIVTKRRGQEAFILRVSRDTAYQGECVKLGIDCEGKILSVQADRVEALVWKRWMTRILSVFLEKTCFYKDGGKLFLHPLVLKYQPEVVLRVLCYKGSFEIPEIKFLNESLKNQIGLDRGGLRNQFLTDLSRYLLDGSTHPARTRIVKMSNDTPTLSQLNPSVTEIATLENLGLFFGYCFIHDPTTSGDNFKYSCSTGRVLGDHCFVLSKNFIKRSINNENLLMMVSF